MEAIKEFLLSNGPGIYGLSGPQGIGKTTICEQMPEDCLVISIDDFYLPNSILEAHYLAAKDQHEEYAQYIFSQRGLPGTHDLDAMKIVIDHFLQSLATSANGDNIVERVCKWPKYDKSALGGRGDRASSYNAKSGHFKYLIIEGWCIGFEYIEGHLNIKDNYLKQYQWLWDSLKGIIQLVTNNISNVILWKIQQETQKNGGYLNEDQIKAFVSRFMPFYDKYYPIISLSSLKPILNLSVSTDHTLGTSCEDVASTFALCKSFMDTQNETREKLVALSRLVTMHSKRVIFAALQSSPNIAQAERELITIKEHLEKIGQILKAEDRFVETLHWSISPGLQEFVEAVLLLQYVQDGTILSFSTLKERYGLNYMLELDYLLGLLDWTGELMRLAINLVASLSEPSSISSKIDEADTTAIQKVHNIYNLLQGLEHDLEEIRSLGIADGAEVANKLSTFKSSLGKVRDVCYDLKIRNIL